jgi:hypothetical protein
MSETDNDFPPDWFRPDVEFTLRATAEGRLYTAPDHIAAYAWLLDPPAPAYPAGDDVSEAVGILAERGYLTWRREATFKTESGETFTGDRMELTKTGRELYDRLNPGR